MRQEVVANFPDYSVTEDGRVFSHKGKRGRELSLRYTKDGYLTVALYKGLGRCNKYVHRLVAEAFIPNPDNLPEVNHKDEDKTNNHVSNLEWCTHQRNKEYSCAKHYVFLSPTGEVTEVFNLTQFCQVHDLQRGHMSGVHNGRLKQHKGWSKFKEVK